MTQKQWWLLLSELSSLLYKKKLESHKKVFENNDLIYCDAFPGQKWIRV